MISRGNSSRLVQNLAIWFLNRKHLSHLFELASMGSSIPYRPRNMHWRCSGGRCRSVLRAVVSTGSLTASPRLPPKHANSAGPNSEQRLTGYVAKPDK